MASSRLSVPTAQVFSVRKAGVPSGRQFSLDDEAGEEDGNDFQVLERKVHGVNMPEASLKVCLKELKRCVLHLWSQPPVKGPLTSCA